MDIEKITEFRDLAPINCEAAGLCGFGQWINTECGPLDIKWLAERVPTTLKKTSVYLERDPFVPSHSF